jgi:tetratricopeptide (TPR) repeat protein
MVDYYLHTAAAADRLLHPVRRPIVLAAPEPGTTVDCFAELSDALAWFSAEHQVLAAVAAVAADSGLDSRAWQLAWAMETFWQRRVDVHEACRVQLTALAAARRQRDLGAQIAAHRGAAAGLIWLGRHADAIKHLDQALSLARKTGDPAAQARVHMTICDGLGRQERHREALIHARQALRLARTSGDIAVLGMALNSVGWFMAKSGGYQRALSFCQHALALQRRAGDVNGMLYTLDSLAYVHRKLGHHAEAVTVSRQAVELMIRTGHRYDLAMALADIGDARQAAGEPRRAREAWRQARDILAGYEGLIDEGIARVRDSGVSREPIGARDRH